MLAKAFAWVKRSVARLGRGWPLTILVCLLVLGLFGAGAATGWYLSDRYGVRSAADIQVTAAAPSVEGLEGSTMPDLRGLAVATARQVLADVGLGDVVVTERQQPWVGVAGRVVSQEPVVGQPNPSQVSLFVSAPAVVPDVVGTDVTEAVRSLQLLGAEVAVRRIYKVGVPADRTLSVSPAAGKAITGRVVLTASAPAASMDLTELNALQSDCGRDTDVVVNGVKHATGLTCRGGQDFATAVYLLGRHTAQLTLTVGQPDTVEPGDRMLVEIVTDGKLAVSIKLGYGQAKELTVSTVGVLRLELRVRLDPPPTDYTSGIMAFAGIQLVGSGDELLALRELQQ
jgi:hypothetical protein